MGKSFLAITNSLFIHFFFNNSKKLYNFWVKKLFKCLLYEEMYEKRLEWYHSSLFLYLSNIEDYFCAGITIHIMR